MLKTDREEFQEFIKQEYGYNPEDLDKEEICTWANQMYVAWTKGRDIERVRIAAQREFLKEFINTDNREFQQKVDAARAKYPSRWR